MSIYVTKSYLPPIDEYIEKIRPIWESRLLTNMGPLHKQLEQRLQDFLGVEYDLLCTNGHTALELALQAFDLKGEVITTPFTFASTTHAIVRCGLTPVFCDIKEDDFTMDPEKIEALITDKTCAIMPVHVYGQICDVEAIDKIAKKHNLKVIYDAAHAFGEEYKGIGVANYGDASIFSFHATKAFNSVEGGCVIVKDYEHAVKVYQLKNFGFMGEDLVSAPGENGKLSEFHAAMGLCNLDHFDEICEGRKRVVELYRKNLSGVSGIYYLSAKEHQKDNYAYFPIVVDEQKFGKTRDDIYNELVKHDIYPRRYFYPLTKDFTCYKDKYGQQETPVAKYVSDHILCLPLYDSLEDTQVNNICKIILDLMGAEE